MMEELLKNVAAITFLDLGCSGKLDQRWSALFPKLSLVGFDPNEEECRRLASLEHPFNNAQYLPYALAGQQGPHQLYITKNQFCYSILRPNTPWLNRFQFKDLFEVVEQTEINCTTLDKICQEKNIQPDIMKLDIQGLELPVLNAGSTLLDNLFCIETESGFTRNYIKESVFWEISEFMEQNGYIMYDINLCRMVRDVDAKEGVRQPLWCQATWLYDYVGNNKVPTKRQARVALATALALHYYDFACELQNFCIEKDVFTKELYDFTSTDTSAQKPPLSLGGRFFARLPKNVQRWLHNWSMKRR